MAEGDSQKLLEWYDLNRRDLPWRRTRDPYRIWLSEIMLQQTQVETVKGYYRRFLELFPTVEALAAAPESAVLKAWEGLGYYSRARNLLKAAQTVKAMGNFPADFEGLLKLPGVGAYTAGAIASIAYNQRVPAVDGNVYRVISRFCGVREDVGQPAVQKAIRALALELTPFIRPGDFNQALMELGATLCSPASPQCLRCPWQARCDAFKEGDAPLLPVHLKKPPQRVTETAVCLATFGGRVLLVRRAQRLLKGLYAPIIVEETDEALILEQLNALGLACALMGKLGTARHVFTHRIWEMTLFHYRLSAPPSPALLAELDGLMADRRELAALPMPTAVKAARAMAAALLQEAEQSEL